MRSEHEANLAIEKYGDMVKRICFLHLKNEFDTEDIFQNVFIKYLVYEGEFENAEHEKAWFARVTINLCKDFLKSAFRKNTVSMEYLSENTPAAQDEEKREVLRAVLSLPDKYKNAVYLHYAKEPLVVLAETGSSTLETRIETTVDSLSAPVQAGTVLGRLTVQVNGETVGSTELVVLQDYERSFWLYAKDLVRPWLPLLAAVGIALLIGLVLLARLLAHKAAVRRRRKALRVAPPRSRENP